MKKQKNYEIDWIDFDLHVDGNVEKITDGSILYTTLYDPRQNCEQSIPLNS